VQGTRVPVPAATEAPRPTATGPPGRPCADDRLAVRTLSDDAASTVNLTPIVRSIAELRQLPAPSGLTADTPRQPRAERIAFTLQVDLLDAARGPDGTLTMVVADSGALDRTLVVELPDPGCQAVAGSMQFVTIAEAHAAVLTSCSVMPGGTPVRLYGSAVISGVGFYDPRPERAGAAPNGLSLAPVLRFQGVGCNPHGPPTPTSTPTRSPTSTTPTVSPTRTPTPSATATQTQTYTPTVTLTPTPTPIVFSGAGQGTTTYFPLAAGSATFAIGYAGQNSFHAQLLDDADDFVAWLAIVSGGSYSASTTIAIQRSAYYRITVASFGSWSFEVRQP
jgi:hypothetical protein